MNYSPRGRYVWDAWTMPTPDRRVHLYHLQFHRDRPEAPPALAHAVSDNLYDWEERPDALGPNPDDPDDDLQLWTGCATWHEGTGYLHYTRRSSRTHGAVQSIGLATTRDPDHWTRHPGPVIVPDPRWYATEENPVGGVVDARDLAVVKDPDGPGWWGYYATRRPAASLCSSSVIACAYSRDLVHWEQRPPALVSDKFACVEVPDVFFLAGRWHMTCLTGHFYGARGLFSDPYLTNGTIRFVSDRPEGPFVEVKDNVLLASHSCGPISVKSLVWRGERYFLYTDREKKGYTDAGDWTFGTLSTPKRAGLDADGDLALLHDPGLDAHASAPLDIDWDVARVRLNRPWGQIWRFPSARLTVGETIRFESPSHWGVLPFGLSEESFILEADLDFPDCAAAGFAIRMDKDGPRADFVLLDREQGATLCTNSPNDDRMERRLTRLGDRHHLRIVNRLEHLEVYVDNVLRLSCPRYAGIGGGLGLLVDRGTATFSNLRIRRLAITRPE